MSLGGYRTRMLLLHCDGSFFRAYRLRREMIVEPIWSLTHRRRPNLERIQTDEEAIPYSPGIRKYTDGETYRRRR